MVVQKILLVLLLGAIESVFAGTGMGGGVAGSFIDTSALLLEQNFEQQILVAGKNSLLREHELPMVSNLTLIEDLEYNELRDLSWSQRPLALKLSNGGIRSFWIHDGPIAGTLELSEFAGKD